MNKNVLFNVLVAFVLVTLSIALPGGSALAARQPVMIHLFVNNNTGGLVNLSLDAGGYKYNYNYSIGLFESEIPSGRYTYYAVTPCGVESGVMNLDHSKKLEFFCSNQGREINLRSTYQVSCDKMFQISKNDSYIPDCFQQ